MPTEQPIPRPEPIPPDANTAVGVPSPDAELSSRRGYALPEVTPDLPPPPPPERHVANQGRWDAASASGRAESAGGTRAEAWARAQIRARARRSIGG